MTVAELLAQQNATLSAIASRLEAIEKHLAALDTKRARISTQSLPERVLAWLATKSAGCPGSATVREVQSRFSLGTSKEAHDILDDLEWNGHGEVIPLPHGRWRFVLKS